MGTASQTPKGMKDYTTKGDITIPMMKDRMIALLPVKSVMMNEGRLLCRRDER